MPRGLPRCSLLVCPIHRAHQDVTSACEHLFLPSLVRACRIFAGGPFVGMVHRHSIAAASRAHHRNAGLCITSPSGVNGLTRKSAFAKHVPYSATELRLSPAGGGRARQRSISRYISTPNFAQCKMGITPIDARFRNLADSEKFEMECRSKRGLLPFQISNSAFHKKQNHEKTIIRFGASVPQLHQAPPMRHHCRPRNGRNRPRANLCGKYLQWHD